MNVYNIKHLLPPHSPPPSKTVSFTKSCPQHLASLAGRCQSLHPQWTWVPKDHLHVQNLEPLDLQLTGTCEEEADLLRQLLV